MQKDPENALRFNADMEHEKGNYIKEIEWLKKLLNINPDDGYSICTRIAIIYRINMKNYSMSDEYMTKATMYPQKIKESEF